jgi:hypothetical protein
VADRQEPPRRKSVKGYPGVYYRKDKKGGRTYEVTYLDSTGQRRWSTINGDLEAADKTLRAIKTKLDLGQKVVPCDRRFEQFASEWLENEKRRLRPNTVRNYESALRLRLYPRFGPLRLAEVDEDRVPSSSRTCSVMARPPPRSGTPSPHSRGEAREKAEESRNRLEASGYKGLV